MPEQMNRIQKLCYWGFANKFYWANRWDCFRQVITVAWLAGKFSFNLIEELIKLWGWWRAKWFFEFDLVETGYCANHEILRKTQNLPYTPLAYALVLEKAENHRNHRNLALSVTLPPWLIWNQPCPYFRTHKDCRDDKTRWDVTWTWRTKS